MHGAKESLRVARTPFGDFLTTHEGIAGVVKVACHGARQKHGYVKQHIPVPQAHAKAAPQARALCTTAEMFAEGSQEDPAVRAAGLNSTYIPAPTKPPPTLQPKLFTDATKAAMNAYNRALAPQPVIPVLLTGEDTTLQAPESVGLVQLPAHGRPTAAATPRQQIPVVEVPTSGTSLNNTDYNEGEWTAGLSVNTYERVNGQRVDSYHPVTKQWEGYKMRFTEKVATVLIFKQPDPDGKINGVVVFVGGSGDWPEGKKQTYACFSRGERFRGIGLRIIVLPNLQDPLMALSRMAWEHKPHPFCIAIIQHAWTCLGALSMVGQSRGSWWGQEWAISHSHWFFDTNGNSGGFIGLTGYDGKYPEKGDG